MGRRRSLSLCAIAALTFGCGDDGRAGRPDGVQPGFIVWTSPIPDGLDAPVTGIVHIDDNGCVYLAYSESSEREPAIWPFGATFDGTTIRTAAGDEIRDGDFILGGGGAVEYQHEYYVENTTLSVDLALLHDCGEIRDDRIQAFNALSTVEILEEMP